MQKTSITLAALFIFLASCSSSNVDSVVTEKWSNTSPPINLEHIFSGEINKHGKPTGFHARPDGKDPSSARIKRIMSKPNKAGVYTARVEVYDKSTDQWREKFSTMFPDKLKRDEVVQAIANAYAERNPSEKQPWSGPSGFGFPIQGYVLNNGNINTAFPVFIKD
ncbi:MAG: EndoU domain-containing protein [Gammaproteobacteria bacterium]|nr:EndoU domain-containing protein [Gammaproteobacteria bacterium]